MRDFKPQWRVGASASAKSRWSVYKTLQKNEIIERLRCRAILSAWWERVHANVGNRSIRGLLFTRSSWSHAYFRCFFFFFVFLLWLISRVCAGVLTKTTTKNICIIWIKKQQLIISSVRLFYLAAYYLYFDFFTFHATQCFFFRFILYSENRWYTRVLLTILLFDGR